MATKLNRELSRATNTPAIGKQVAATRQREAREPGRGASRSQRRPETYRFDFASIKSLVIEFNPLCFTIVVNPPRPKKSDVPDGP